MTFCWPGGSLIPDQSQCMFAPFRFCLPSAQRLAAHCERIVPGQTLSGWEVEALDRLTRGVAARVVSSKCKSQKGKIPAQTLVSSVQFLPGIKHWLASCLCGLSPQGGSGLTPAFTTFDPQVLPSGFAPPISSSVALCSCCLTVSATSAHVRAVATPSLNVALCT